MPEGTPSVCHIGHAELRVTNLEESIDFFTRLIGLTLTDRTEERAYLRAWQDWDHHTLALVQSDVSGLDHCGWRVQSEQELDRFAAHLDAYGTQHWWTEPGAEPGQGRGLRFNSASGAPFELYASMEHYEAPSELRSPLPSHPQLFPTRIAPRRFDHINFFVDDVQLEQEWLTNTLGIHHRYFMERDDGTRVGSWLSRTAVTHEIALARNPTPTGSMLNHVAYYLDAPDDVLRMASMLAENSVQIEWGPGRHATSGATFLYFFEPSGNRVELWTGDHLIFEPDWEPLRWGEDTMGLGLELWGSKPPDSFFTYGTGLPGASHTAGSSGLR